MNPIHLVIAPTFLAANDDRDAANFGAGPYLRLAKLLLRRRPGHTNVAPGYILALGIGRYHHYTQPA